MGTSPAAGDPRAGCVFTYTVGDVRLTLLARTLDAPTWDVRVGVTSDGDVALSRVDDPFAAATPVRHTGAGEGITVTWTFTPERPDHFGSDTRSAARETLPRAAEVPERAEVSVCRLAGAPHTRLRARVEVIVEPGHPLATIRAALCRTVACRVPVDLERLRLLLARAEACDTGRSRRHR